MHNSKMSLQNSINYVMKNSIVASNCQTLFMEIITKSDNEKRLITNQWYKVQRKLRTWHV